MNREPLSAEDDGALAEWLRERVLMPERPETDCFEQLLAKLNGPSGGAEPVSTFDDVGI